MNENTDAADTLSLIDTNLLVYAYDKTDKRKHEKAKQLLEQCWRGEKNYAISVQNLAEFSVVVTQKVPSPISVDEATQIITDIIEFPSWRVLSYTGQTLKQAMLLYATTKRHFWDALIAATMMQAGVLHIYTENVSDFSVFEHIIAKNPLKDTA